MCRVSVRSLEAPSQNPCSCGPMSGQPATASGGAGRCQVPLLRTATVLSRDSVIDITIR
ncbi:hypothetical protein D3C80_2158120 [compost metagenome]